MDYHLVIILSVWSIFLDLLLKIRHQFLFYRLDVLKNSLGAIQYPPRLEVLHIIRLVLALRSLETFFVILILFDLFLGRLGLLEQFAHKLALCMLHQLSLVLLALHSLYL